MAKQNDDLMSRKQFLGRTTAGLFALGVSGAIPSWLMGSESPGAGSFPRYRTLGRSGIEVSALGFGVSRTMEPALVKRALEAGITFFDTGRSYFNGQNEVMVGKALKAQRKNVIIQSKMKVRINAKDRTLTSAEGARKLKNRMRLSLDQSLKALQTDYIDVFLVHRVSSVEVIHHEVVLEFLSTAKKRGQLRAAGFSSHSNQIELLRANNESRFYDVVMVPYNHRGSFNHARTGRHSEWDQPALEAEMKRAEENNIAIVAMKTCSAGPYSPDGDSAPSYKEALKWVLNHSFIKTAAAAMGNLEEMNENVRAMT